MKVLVVDGAGGSIGQQIVSRLLSAFGTGRVDITVLGTNAIAASNMMKAGANRGASGENSFRVNAGDAEIIMGPVAIMIPNSFMGELTLKMADYLSLSSAKKILLPLGQHLSLVGTSSLPLPHLMDEAIKLVKEEFGKKNAHHATEVK
jgi:hypothetical protein